MFTGIITAIGEVAAREGGRFTVHAPYDAAGIAVGASIACDGCCLTVTAVQAEGSASLFTVDVSTESLARTTLQAWRSGTRVNLERALRAGEEFGGHMVTGHVDGTARIVDMRPDGTSRRVTLEASPLLAPLIASKGSIALDGTSLTVHEVEGTRFGLNLIPHTLTVTTWGSKTAGQLVNVEIDLIARYVARLLEWRG